MHGILENRITDIVVCHNLSLAAQAELARQISCLPIRTDTLTMRNKKQELDRKLAEVEEAIKIFSRPKVFIKMDS